MTLKNAVDKIGNLIFPLSEECKNEIENCAQLLEFNTNTIIVKEGQIDQNMYFICEGSARAYYFKDGKDISDWFAFENDFITAIQSFFSAKPSPHFIEVHEQSILLKLTIENIMYLSAKYLEFERLGNQITTQTMLKLQERIVSLQFESAQQKYENLLAVYPDITLRLKLTHIASYLGITLETLSRIRKQKSRI